MIIIVKLCAFVTLVFAVTMGFQLLVDAIRFGGPKLSDGTVMRFGTTLGLFFASAAMLVTSLDRLIS